MAANSYFAFGSNLLSARIEVRLGPCVVHGRAELRGYRLNFDKLGSDGSGKCNITRTGDDVDAVYGVLYGLEDEQAQALHGFEGGYDYETVEVLLSGRSMLDVRIAGTYMARPESISPGAPPFDWYLAYVTAGAHEHRLPHAYIRWLTSYPVRRDSNADRQARNRLGKPL